MLLFRQMVLLFNMGLPMIIPTLVFMVLGLVPIVLIETYYVARKLQIRFSRTIGTVAIANILSTLVGLPLTWLLLFFIQLASGGVGMKSFAGKLLAVTLRAPWLAPVEADLMWMFHAAALFLLIPFFFATWLIEYLVMSTKLVIEMPDRDPPIDTPAERIVSRAVRNANILSYGLLAILLVASFIISTLRAR